MQSIKIILTGVIIFFSTLTFAFGANVAKIGIVDIQKVFDISNRGKIAMAELQSQGKKITAELKNKETEITELTKKLERESMVMNKETRDKKLREINIKKYDFKLLKDKYTINFRTQEERIVNRIKKELIQLIDKIGKKQGFLLILEKREAGVLYNPDAIDITDSIIKLYNAEFLKKSKYQK